MKDTEELIRLTQKQSKLNETNPLNKSSQQMMNLTARQATEYIYKKEGLPGFMRGFVPSMYKNFWNAGTYFSVLYYLEEVIRGSGLFSES